MLDLLAQNPLLLLFTIIGLGYLIGNIDIFGLKLGVAALLFVGMFFGAIDPRLRLPDHIYVIGMVLFVYAIGLQSGHGFFASFKKRGFRFSIISVLLLLLGGVSALVLHKVMRLPAQSVAGLFCGALTSTPAMAAAVETAKSLSAHLSPEKAKLFISGPVVVYGLTYPFGVFGVILAFFICNKFFKKNQNGNVLEEDDSAAKKSIISRTFLVSNPAIIGKSVEQALQPFKDPGFVLTRIKKDKTEIITSQTILELNDQVVAVGDEDAIQRAELIFGEQAKEHLVLGWGGITYRRIFVSNKAVVGKMIRELSISKDFPAVITRMRRGDVDIVPKPDTVLEMGDRIRVLTYRDNMQQITKYFGDSVKSISETDYLSISLGIVLGFFLGMIPIPLAHGLQFKLGPAGGPLIAGLILGRLERTGPIIWEMPLNANLVLRQVGLVLFLAAIGTKAGDGFFETVKAGGWWLIAAGGILTMFISITTILIGYKYLKLPMAAIMGMMSGIQTQSACLAYANQQTESDLPNIWYTTVYPASMVAKIILAQVIVSILILFD